MKIQTFKAIPMAPRFLRVNTAVAYSGKSRTSIYDALANGKIAARKDGKTLLIDRESLDQYLDGLPLAAIRAPAPKVSA